ncbi:hypothetical protein [Trinickia sp. NRRL B-1857]|uniref:hypothetical protein n=1 Tax=Trinickia sp. NRRL B-1857 TaxID=3162879 RepID=UPI003D29C318
MHARKRPFPSLDDDAHGIDHRIDIANFIEPVLRRHIGRKSIAISSERCGRRTPRTTPCPSCVNRLEIALPINPLAPHTKTFMTRSSPGAMVRRITSYFSERFDRYALRYRTFSSAFRLQPQRFIKLRINQA